MKFFKSLLFIFTIIFSNLSFANYEKDIYDEEICKTIYESIGIFLYISDDKWENEDEEQALLYSTAAANYSIIYNTVCKD